MGPFSLEHFTVPDLKALFDIVVEYFERFGAKSCVFNDISPYVYLLNEEERLQVHYVALI